MSEENEKLYTLFAHGWDLGKFFKLTKGKNIKIIMMQKPQILHQFMDKEMSISDLNFILKKFIENSQTTSNYLKKMFNLLNLDNNKMCVFDSEGKNNKVPNMLLSLGKKENELNALFDVLHNEEINPSELEFDKLVFTLDDLVKNLGENFTLLVYACRGTITNFQIENMEKIREFMGLKAFIKYKRIEIKDDNEKGLESKCKPLASYLGYKKNDITPHIKEKFRQEIKSELPKQQIIEFKEVKPITLSGTGYIPPHLRPKKE